MEKRGNKKITVGAQERTEKMLVGRNDFSLKFSFLVDIKRRHIGREGFMVQYSLVYRLRRPVTRSGRIPSGHLQMAPVET